MMKRYLLFAGLSNNRLCGILNLVSDFGSVYSAKEHFSLAYSSGKFDWAQIFDLKTRRLIAYSMDTGMWDNSNIGMSDIRRIQNDN